MNKQAFLTSSLLFLFLPSSYSAPLPQWKIIPAESQLTFTATQNGAPVSGEFKNFSGEIAVDPQHYANSRIHIIIDMNSLNTSFTELTTTLSSADWFDSKLFPKAEFTAQKFTKTGEKNYQAAGILTIRDKTVPVVLDFSAEETSKGHALVIGNTHINRLNFSVGQGEWASTDEIKSEVLVEFKIGAVQQ